MNFCEIAVDKKDQSMTQQRTKVATLLTTTLLALGLSLNTLPAAAATNTSPVAAPHHINNLQVPNTIVKPKVSNKNALGVATLPATVDLTQYATTPGDQGAEGACVSWAIGHTMLGWYADKAGAPQQFAPMYLYSQTHLDSTSDGGGSYAQDAYGITADQGIDTQADYTQGDRDFTTPLTSAEKANAAQYKTTPFNELFVEPDGNAGSAGSSAIKAALAAGNPVGIGIPVYYGFNFLDPTNYTWDTSDDDGEANYEGGHYLIALGYNATGVIVENSWGTSWGNKGYATLTWDFIQKKATEAETIGGGFINTLPATSYTAPTAPRNLKVSAVTTSTATVTWDAPLLNGNKPVTTYNLTIAGEGRTETIQLDAKYIGERFKSLKPYTTYTYTVSATNSIGTSPTTTVKFKTHALTPTLHSIKHVASTKSIKLTWYAATARTGHITKYVITVKKGSKVISAHAYKSTTRKANLTHLKRHTTYRVVFTAYNSAGKATYKTYTVKTK